MNCFLKFSIIPPGKFGVEIQTINGCDFRKYPSAACFISIWSLNLKKSDSSIITKAKSAYDLRVLALFLDGNAFTTTSLSINSDCLVSKKTLNVFSIKFLSRLIKVTAGSNLIPVIMAPIL